MEEELNPPSDGAFFFFIPFLQPRKLFQINLISLSPGHGQCGPYIPLQFPCPFIQAFSPPRDPLAHPWQRPRVPRDSPLSLFPSKASSAQHPRSSTPKPSWEAPGSLSRGSNHPLSNGTPQWVIKPLQKPPGDPPALPWVCGAGSAPQAAHP